MKRLDVRMLIGVVLIAAGVLVLLQTLGLIQGGLLTLLWALAFGTGGAIFLFVFLNNQSNWWTLIPACALFSLAAVIALEELGPETTIDWSGVLVLGGIGLPFWLIYIQNPENWWAIIPGGTLSTLAAVAGLSSTMGGDETGGVFFLGLALTFGLLYLLPTPEANMKWALIPAAVLGVMGALLTAAAASALQYIWPAALVLIGLYILFRTLSSGQPSSEDEQSKGKKQT